MLSLSVPVSSILIKYLVIARVSHQKEKTRTLNDISTKFRVSVAVSLIDAVIIGGVSFFASLAALGYENLLINIKLALFSSITMAGLSFFNTLKMQMKKS